MDVYPQPQPQTSTIDSESSYLCPATNYLHSATATAATTITLLSLLGHMVSVYISLLSLRLKGQLLLY